MISKKLEDLFDLASSADDEQPTTPILNELTIPILDQNIDPTTSIDTLTKIENALPQVRGLEASDSEMDELAELAVNSYKDLLDMGMQVEARFSAEIFNTAATFLGHGITAKTAKINKKLKMLEIQLKKATLDAKLATKNEEVNNIPLGEGQSLDRNALLKMFNPKNNE